MLYSTKTLKLYETLGRARPLKELSQGMRVGRGFADVGYEEFIVQPGEKLLSLLTGSVSKINDVRQEHLFEILSTDQLIAEVHSKGFQIANIDSVDRRQWRVTLKSNSDELIIQEESRSLEECFLKLVLALYQTEVKPEERCLKTAPASH